MLPKPFPLVSDDRYPHTVVAGADVVDVVPPVVPPVVPLLNGCHVPF